MRLGLPRRRAGRVAECVRVEELLPGGRDPVGARRDLGLALRLARAEQLDLGLDRLDRGPRRAALELREGDLRVLNDTRVLRARLRGRLGTGGAVEVLLLAPVPASSLEAAPRWTVCAKPGRELTIDD